MKVLQTIGSLNAGSGGTSTCTYELVSAMNAAGFPVDVLTLCPQSPTERMLGEDSFIKAYPHDARTPLAISRNLRRSLAESNYDLYHTNGLWMDVNHATCAHARKIGKPYIVSLHGMLYPEALTRSAWKKKLMLALGHKKDIAFASCIHATCVQEMEYYRALGYTNPVAIIPNPVGVPDYLSSIQRSNDCFRIGFLGRIHPRKHVHDLITAWSCMGDFVKEGELLIIGQGDDDYMNQLHTQVAQNGLRNVRFAGFLSGKDKFEALASLSGLFVPSDFENFGMIIPEALLVKTPVMASLGTPWEELNTHCCGWWRDNSVESLCACIREAQRLSNEELLAMGERGKQLILNSYSSTKVAQMMTTLYGWLLGENEKPDFVYV